MKIFYFLFLFFIVSCSSNDFSTKLKKTEKYKNTDIQIAVVDTFYNHELLDTITYWLNYHKDILSKLELNEKLFSSLYKQEKEFRKNVNYIAFIYNHYNDTLFVRDYRSILSRTNFIIENFNSVDVVDKYEVYCWYEYRNNLIRDLNGIKYVNNKKFCYKMKRLERKKNILIEKPNDVVYYKVIVKSNNGIDEVFFDSDKKIINF